MEVVGLVVRLEIKDRMPRAWVIGSVNMIRAGSSQNSASRARPSNDWFSG